MSAPVIRVPGDVLVHLRRARDHIDRHFAEPLDLEVLASTAGISKYHFLRLFSAAYGITPAAYLSERRIERAQDLLRSANLTVTEDGARRAEGVRPVRLRELTDHAQRHTNWCLEATIRMTSAGGSAEDDRPVAVEQHP